MSILSTYELRKNVKGVLRKQFLLSNFVLLICYVIDFCFCFLELFICIYFFFFVHYITAAFSSVFLSH